MINFIMELFPAPAQHVSNVYFALAQRLLPVCPTNDTKLGYRVSRPLPVLMKSRDLSNREVSVIIVANLP